MCVSASTVASTRQYGFWPRARSESLDGTALAAVMGARPEARCAAVFTNDVASSNYPVFKVPATV